MNNSKVKTITITTIVLLTLITGGLRWAINLQNVHATQTVVQQLSIPATLNVNDQQYVAKAVNNEQVQYQDTDSNLKVADYQVIDSNDKHTAQNQYNNLKMPTRFAGQSVKLADNTQAVVQGAMGHVYVQWQRGDWTVTTVTTPDVAKNPGTAVKQADRVNQAIKQSQLTDQSIDRGSILIDQDSTSAAESQISWQRGKRTVNTTGTNAEMMTKLASQGLTN